MFLYLAMIDSDADKSKLEILYSEYKNLMYYTEENPCRKRYIALNEDFLTACDSDVEYSESGGRQYR